MGEASQPCMSTKHAWGTKHGRGWMGQDEDGIDHRVVSISIRVHAQAMNDSSEYTAKDPALNGCDLLTDWSCHSVIDV